ncbi:ankyrin repeat domain-containing protein [Gemmatimonas aurantiaca]|uniref:ankyrin repeat domain-containing protein n=1 Tax=Gemmatimonas aurantiaca TaxID=173480 RepID=UPI00301C6A6B
MSRPLPEHPSLEHLRKQAKDLLRHARAEDADARARLAAIDRGASGTPATLADAQLVIAREHGFPSWPKLVHHVETVDGGGFVLRPLIRPVELSPGRRWTLADGTIASTDDVFAMFVAARDGDMAAVKRLVAHRPALATVEYNYTPPIHFAVREGHRNVAEFLLNHGADPAYRSYPFQESLLTFAEDRGHMELADLLRHRLTRRFAVVPGTRTIIEAATRGDLAAVEAELARDVTLARSSDETGDTALHRAAKNGFLSIVRVLLAAGANVDAIRGDGYRPVHCALMPNWFFQVSHDTREEIVELLLSQGARYTVFIAALRGDERFVRDALARDRSFANFEDTCHHRVLSAAVRRHDVAMTRLLLDHGADPNLPEEGAPRGLSLWIAVNDGEEMIVRLLLAHGADPNGAVESSGTPMSHAEGKDVALAELLRQHGGRSHRASERDQVARFLEEGKLDDAERLLHEHPHLIHDDEAGWGDGILAGPANRGRHDIIAMLLRLGARVPSVSKWAPYYYFKHEATAAFLLEHGMDPNHMNWHRFTLLHHMAAQGELGKARLLLDHGADIDAIDDEYRSSPLGVAAHRGQGAIIELLLARGADPDAGGASWALPLSWAERKGHRTVADMLQKATGHRP